MQIKRKKSTRGTIFVGYNMKFLSPAILAGSALILGLREAKYPENNK